MRCVHRPSRSAFTVLFSPEWLWRLTFGPGFPDCRQSELLMGLIPSPNDGIRPRVTAAPLPNGSMLPWDHRLLSAIFGSCPESLLCKCFAFCIPCKVSASPVVFLYECFLSSTSLHDVNQTRLPPVPSHAPHFTLCTFHHSVKIKTHSHICDYSSKGLRLHF